MCTSRGCIWEPCNSWSSIGTAATSLHELDKACGCSQFTALPLSLLWLVPPAKPKPSDLGQHCPDKPLAEAAERVGLYLQSWDPINLIVANALGSVMCTTHTRGDAASYAHWLVKVARGFTGATVSETSSSPIMFPSTTVPNETCWPSDLHFNSLPPVSPLMQCLASSLTQTFQERMNPQEWRTFVYESPEQDSVVLLFDMLYEFKRVFTRQYWMGATP